jgi:hypothetical protein
MSEKTGFKYSIKFNQSLTSGTIAFEGYFAFDHPTEFDTGKLLGMLQEQETAFANAGYKIASSIPNNMKQLSNGGKENKK